MPISGQLIFPENSTYADFEVSLVDDNIPELEVVYQVSIYIIMYVIITWIISTCYEQTL